MLCWTTQVSWPCGLNDTFFVGGGGVGGLERNLMASSSASCNCGLERAVSLGFCLPFASVFVRLSIGAFPQRFRLLIG